MDITFRQLANSDLENIVQWMQDEGVARWWYAGRYADGSSEEAIRAEWGPRARGEPNIEDKTDCYIVTVDATDIGLIQTSLFADYPEHAAEVQVPESAGVDVLIGLPEWRNRGVGSALIKQFVNEVVFANPAVQRCTIDPDPENRRAIRAYEKVGFRYVRSYRSKISDIDAYLMVLERPVL